MTSNNNSSNQVLVPEAREALERFKMEAAQEVGVNLKQGYNGDLTSREAGSVGGQMVNIMCPVRHGEIFTFRRKNRVKAGHVMVCEYIVRITA